MLGVDHAQHIFQKADIRQILFSDNRQIKIKGQISDAVRVHIMPQNFGVAKRKLSVADRSAFLCDILPGKHRDFLQLFLCGRCLLEFLQFCCFFYQLLYLFFTETCLKICQFLCRLCLQFCSQSLFRCNDNNRHMCVIQQIFLHQFLVIITLYCITEFLINIQLFDISKRITLAVQPAVHNVDSVHQALRIRAVICLTKTELGRIDTCQQCFFIDAVFHLLFQYLADHCQELFFVTDICIFSDYRKGRLLNAALKRA